MDQVTYCAAYMLIVDWTIFNIYSHTKFIGPGASGRGAAHTLPHDQSLAELQSAEHGEALLW